MKIRSPCHLSVFLMAVLTFSVPFTQHTLQAGQSQRRGFAAGAIHTQGNSCLIPGINTAPTSHVPRILYAHQLLGKSPEYVATYTQTGNQTTVVSDLIDILPTGCVVAGAILVVAGAAVMLYIMWELQGLWSGDPPRF